MPSCKEGNEFACSKRFKIYKLLKIYYLIEYIANVSDYTFLNMGRMGLDKCSLSETENKM